MSDDAAARELPLLIGALRGDSEMLLLVGHPDASGVVHVRRWSSADWSSAPEVRAERASSFLEWVERQVAMGRTMNQSVYAVRLWLRGEATAAR